MSIGWNSSIRIWNWILFVRLIQFRELFFIKIIYSNQLISAERNQSMDVCENEYWVLYQRYYWYSHEMIYSIDILHAYVGMNRFNSKCLSEHFSSICFDWESLEHIALQRFWDFRFRISVPIHSNLIHAIHSLFECFKWPKYRTVWSQNKYVV